MRASVLGEGPDNQALTKAINTCGRPAGNQGEHFAGGGVDIAEIGNLFTGTGMLLIDEDLLLDDVSEYLSTTRKHNLIIWVELIEVTKHFAIATHMTTKHDVVCLSGVG